MHVLPLEWLNMWYSLNFLGTQRRKEQHEAALSLIHIKCLNARCYHVAFVSLNVSGLRCRRCKRSLPGDLWPQQREPTAYLCFYDTVFCKSTHKVHREQINAHFSLVIPLSLFGDCNSTPIRPPCTHSSSSSSQPKLPAALSHFMGHTWYTKWWMKSSFVAAVIVFDLQV